MKNESFIIARTVEEKVQLLIQKYTVLKEENEGLKRQVLRLKDKIKSQQEELEMSEKLKTIAYLQTVTDEVQKDQLKKYLDLLIKNLDESINLL